MAVTVALVGATHPAARALAIALEADAGVDRVLGLARTEPPVLGPKFEYVPLGADGTPGDRLQGADVVVVFPLFPATRDQAVGGQAALEEVRGVVTGAELLGRVRTLVLWSSGMVYGAYPDNPVPMGEDQPISPNPDVPLVVQLAEMERAVLAFRGGDGAVVLRAAPVWAPDWGTLMGRSLQAPALIGVRGANPAVQGLQPDDAVSALALAVGGSLQGVYNVAPADWISAEDAARAAGRRRVVLPEQVAVTLAEQLWNLGVAVSPPGVLRYHTHPWVLDAGRLTAAGWTPTVGSAVALARAGSVARDGVTVGRLTVRRGDLYRSAGAGLAAVAMLALARRRAGRR